MVNFGAKLKELRTGAGITQKELADKLGVTKSVISYYELQERTPSPEIIIKLASIFNVSADYLLGIEKKSVHTIDLSGLCDDDIRYLNSTVEYLRKKNLQNKIK